MGGPRAARLVQAARLGGSAGSSSAGSAGSGAAEVRPVAQQAPAALLAVRLAQAEHHRSVKAA